VNLLWQGRLAQLCPGGPSHRGEYNTIAGAPCPDIPVRANFLNEPSFRDIVMHEYDAIRNEINTSLSAQVSILSLGSATSGLLVAAADGERRPQRYVAGNLTQMSISWRPKIVKQAFGLIVAAASRWQHHKLHERGQ
jgi:hypothetical protein